jgi:hypothetical protein
VAPLDQAASVNQSGEGARGERAAAETEEIYAVAWVVVLCELAVEPLDVPLGAIPEA